MTDTTTRRRTYLDARAALNKASSDLGVASINSGALQGGPLPEMTEGRRAALLAYEAAREAYLVASREYYG